MSRPTHEPAPFLCTFCWTTYSPPIRPKTLGHEKRVCCQSCYNHLLDLAICWVCGELVVRGDDVVSLGWCFWHRGCFGCLICGQPISLDNAITDELGRAGGIKGGKGNRIKDKMEQVKPKRKRKPEAVELEEVPVCRGCDGMLVETGSHREDVEMFLGRGNVEQHDGGISEARWDRIKKSTSKDGTWEEGNARRLAVMCEDSSRSTTSASRSSKTLPPQRRSRRRTQGESTSVDSGYSTMGRDGSEDTRRDGSFDPESYFPHMPKPPSPPLTPPPANPIYVSILDPIKGPSFRPSPTKPIPRWMALFPSARAVSPVFQPIQAQRFSESSEYNFPLEMDGNEDSLYSAAPQSSPDTEHTFPVIPPNNTDSLPTIPESTGAKPIFNKAFPRRVPSGSTKSSASEMTVYFTPPEHTCGFFRREMEKRENAEGDLGGVKEVERSVLKGEVREGCERREGRERSSAVECVSGDGLGVRVPVDYRRVTPTRSGVRGEVGAGSSGAGLNGRVKSNAEFVERYQLAGKEEGGRSKERARSVNRSLERVRGKGSVRNVVGRARDQKVGVVEGREEGDEEDTGKERLRRELQRIFKKP